MTTATDELIEIGLRAAQSPLRQQVKLWARHADEKPDVAADLMATLRWLHRTAPPDRALRALSIGSSEEPQFRLLSAAAGGGLWLYDADRTALAAVRARIGRQMLSGVHLVHGDYTADFLQPDAAHQALANRLGGAPFDLITIHHALYYCPAAEWSDLVATLYETLLRDPGAMHLALMSATDPRPFTTTWLYNHFAEKFFGSRNDQDLAGLAQKLAERPEFSHARFSRRTHAVRFQNEDFADFMAVVWMIMLYPDGHNYTLDQRREITEFVVEQFWQPRRPLTQVQDYLSVLKDEVPPEA
ncbi:MAG: class I SAM-dependent methyltransferase [Pseudomonadota bacterium]